jgi:hypothetical protein
VDEMWINRTSWPIILGRNMSVQIYMHIYCSLFNDAFSVTQIVYHRMKGSNEVNDESGFRRKQSWPNLEILLRH